MKTFAFAFLLLALLHNGTNATLFNFFKVTKQFSHFENDIETLRLKWTNEYRLADGDRKSADTKSATGSEMSSGEEKHQEKELNKKAEETTASMNQQSSKEAANDNAKERHLTADQDGMPSKETNETPKRSSSSQKEKSAEQEQQKEQQQPEADVPTSMEEEAAEKELELDESTTTKEPPPSKIINNSADLDDETTTKMPLPAKKLPNWQVPASQAVGTSGIGIGLLVEGIEQSDFGLSRLDSDYQRSRPAFGFRSCEASSFPSMLQIYYKSQPTADNYEPEAIRVLCFASGGMQNFCACDEQGHCYSANEAPIYAELGPYCDPIDGCHTYLELYQGSLRNTTFVYSHQFDAGPFGHGSPYMKVRAVSCRGCQRIQQVLSQHEQKCQGEWVQSALDQQDLRELFPEPEFTNDDEQP